MISVLEKHISANNHESSKFITDNNLYVCNAINNELPKELYISEFGSLPISKLLDQVQLVVDKLKEIKSFNYKYMAIDCGRINLKLDDVTLDKIISTWASTITDACIKLDIIPLINVNVTSYHNNIVALAKFLSINKRWNVYLSPNQLIRSRKVDVYSDYWVLLKNRIKFINAVDFCTGKGIVEIGLGNTGLNKILREITNQSLVIDFHDLTSKRFKFNRDYILSVKNLMEKHDG